MGGSTLRRSMCLVTMMSCRPCATAACSSVADRTVARLSRSCRCDGGGGALWLTGSVGAGSGAAPAVSSCCGGGCRGLLIGGGCGGGCCEVRSPPHACGREDEYPGPRRANTYATVLQVEQRCVWGRGTTAWGRLGRLRRRAMPPADRDYIDDAVVQLQCGMHGSVGTGGDESVRSLSVMGE